MEIVLRETREDDYRHLKGWFEDRSNNIFFTSDLRDIPEYKKIFFLMALKNRKNQYYTIDLSENLEPVGFLALINIDHGDKFGQLWYVVGKTGGRNRGVMTKAIALLLDKARDELGMHSVFTWVVDGNVASIRVLEKNGFRKMGIQRDAYCRNSEFRDRILFDRLL